MCKAKLYKNGKPNSRIDKCMRNLLLYVAKGDDRLEIVACCCGHGKYPMTILVKDCYGNVWDIVSHETIPGTRKFYKRDKQGYYYIPEVPNTAFQNKKNEVGK